ncbi:MAG: LysR family transcriptional regulator [Halieaceae bacterium]|nr:LysR family transcriptional regulator [Halieaceae bacterium]
MHFNRLDLNLLVGLDALLQEKSVTRAAERLHLTQPTMSGALRKLREHFNDPLLERTGRRMELTPRAEELVNPVREILIRIQGLEDSDDFFDPGRVRRSFSVAMTDVVSSLFLPEIMKRLVREAPGVSLRIESLTPDMHEQLVNGELNLAIRADVHSPQIHSIMENLADEFLFEDQWVCAVSADHPTVGDELSLEEFVELPHASLRFPGEVPTLQEISLMQASLDIDIRLAAPNFFTLFNALPGTSLVTLVPRLMAERLGGSTPVRLLSPPFEISPLREMLVWHSRDSTDAGHRWLRDLFKEVAAGLH